MARINIDDEVLSDPSFMGLVSILGDEEKALGKVLKAFRVAQKYWVDGNKLVPESLWGALKLEDLIVCDLAVRKPEGIYVKGSENAFDWLIQKKIAGQKSGEARRAKSANIELRSNDVQATFELRSNDVRSEIIDDKINEVDCIKTNENELRSNDVRTTFMSRSLPVRTERERNANGGEPLYSLLLKEEEELSTDQTKNIFKPRDLLKMWNDRFDGVLPKVNTKPSPTREKAIKRRLVDYPNAENWELIFNEIANSKFLQGDNQNAWRISIDWLMKSKNNCEKIIEGNYRSSQSARKSEKFSQYDDIDNLGGL